MSLQLDIFGYTYDDANPAFVDAGTFWFHLPTDRLLTKTGVTAYMASFIPAKTMGAKESGSLSAAYTATHLGIPSAPSVGPPPPATTTTTGATPGQPGTFTGPTPATRAALKTLGALGNTTAWKDRRIGQLQEWVRTTNGDLAVWGGTTGPGAGWVAVTAAQINLDITTLITDSAKGWPSGTAPANLAALQTDKDAGNGKGFQADGTPGTGVAFATGQYVVLGDGSKASYNGTVWVAGAAA